MCPEESKNFRWYSRKVMNKKWKKRLENLPEGVIFKHFLTHEITSVGMEHVISVTYLLGNCDRQTDRSTNEKLLH